MLYEVQKISKDVSAKVPNTALSENFDPHVLDSTLRSKFSCRMASGTFAEASKEQWFLIISFVMSLMLTFLFGYTVFRYWQIEVCKSPMQVGNFGKLSNSF